MPRLRAPERTPSVNGVSGRQPLGIAAFCPNSPDDRGTARTIALLRGAWQRSRGARKVPGEPGADHPASPARRRLRLGLPTRALRTAEGRSPPKRGARRRLGQELRIVTTTGGGEWLLPSGPAARAACSAVRARGRAGLRSEVTPWRRVRRARFGRDRSRSRAPRVGEIIHEGESIDSAFNTLALRSSRPRRKQPISASLRLRYGAFRSTGPADLYCASGVAFLRGCYC